MNNALLELSRKTGVKLIATNDAHFLNEQDADAHDRLLCLNTGKDLDDPTRLRYTGRNGSRPGLRCRNCSGMCRKRSKIPWRSLKRLNAIAEQETDHARLPFPEGYTDADEYLRHLTYEGAIKRYAEITPEITERIEYELQTIKRMGYPGYFLIVQDFLRAAREMDVSVGPRPWVCSRICGCLLYAYHRY